MKKGVRQSEREDITSRRMEKRREGGRDDDLAGMEGGGRGERGREVGMSSGYVLFRKSNRNSSLKSSPV